MAVAEVAEAAARTSTGLHKDSEEVVAVALLLQFAPGLLRHLPSLRIPPRLSLLPPLLLPMSNPQTQERGRSKGWVDTTVALSPTSTLQTRLRQLGATVPEGKRLHDESIAMSALCTCQAKRR